MTYALAAAGTGGHVYPAIAVADALREAGVDRSQILFVGGSRLAATAVPAAGYDYLEVEIRGCGAACPSTTCRCRAWCGEPARRSNRSLPSAGQGCDRLWGLHLSSCGVGRPACGGQVLRTRTERGSGHG